MTNQLVPFEFYVLQQFQNKSWYNDNIMNFITSQGTSQQDAYFAIYQLRAKMLLDTHTDERGNQYFTITPIGTNYLNSIANNQFQTQNNQIASRTLSIDEIAYLNQNKKQDKEIIDLTLENFKIQKRMYWLTIIAVIITAVSLYIGISK